MATTAKEALSLVQQTVDKYGEDSPVFFFYFDRGDVEQEWKQLSEIEDFVMKPLTEEGVNELLTNFDDTIDEDTWELLMNSVVDRFVE